MRPFLVSGALLASATSFLQPSSSAFTLGVLRRDALIVPIATYDGKRWEQYWPGPSEDVDVPLGLENVPSRWWGPVGPRETWQIWTSAPSPQLVRVRQPDWARTYCQKQVGLRTDYQPRVWPPNAGARPFPKDGLAVSPPQPVEPIEVLTPDSPERNELAEPVRRAFSDREKTTLKQWGVDYASAQNPRGVIPEPPGEKDLQASLPLTIEALYAYGTARRTYFVEAAREYKKAGACLAAAFATGLIVRDSGRLSVLGFQVGLNSCDRRYVGYMLPLGVMSLPTGVYWIAQRSSWSGEAFDILDISPRPRTTGQRTLGGAC